MNNVARFVAVWRLRLSPSFYSEFCTSKLNRHPAFRDRRAHCTPVVSDGQHKRPQLKRKSSEFKVESRKKPNLVIALDPATECAHLFDCIGESNLDCPMRAWTDCSGRSTQVEMMIWGDDDDVYVKMNESVLGGPMVHGVRMKQVAANGDIRQTGY